MVEQRSEEWFARRLGKVTASRIADVCARTKSGWGAGRANYAAQLVCERLTGEVQESYENAAMRWGTETEPQARAGYSFLTDNPVEEVGFIDHPRIDMTGASPDGVVGEDGLVEIKCPQSATHIKTLLDGAVENKHALQIQWQLACTERQWCDYVSFDPRLPAEMQMWRTRIERDDAKISELEEIVTEFLAEVDQTVARLRERYMQEAA